VLKLFYHQTFFSSFTNHTITSVAIMSTPEVVNVLFALWEGFNALDFTGPLEVLSQAQHDESKLNEHFST